MSGARSTPSDVAASGPGGPPPAAVSAAAAVLVVDDVEDNRELLCRGIRKQGHDVSTAEDGRRALELLAERHFDLVLLDIMMPSVNGYDVLAAMKADPALRHIPVIVVSAVGEQDSVVRCIELGAEDYLLKPFNAVLLRARISASLEKKRLRDREREVLALLQAEQERSERLLLSIFPRAIAERLKAGEASVAESYPDATVLLADVSNFNELAAGKRPTEVVGLLDR